MAHRLHGVAARTDWGGICLRLGQRDSAVDHARRSVSVAGDSGSLRLRAMAYAELRERTRAVETLSRFLSVGGDSPEYLQRAANSTIARMQGVI